MISLKCMVHPQGLEDQFYLQGQLLPQNFANEAADTDINVQLRLHDVCIFSAPIIYISSSLSNLFLSILVY